MRDGAITPKQEVAFRKTMIRLLAERLEREMSEKLGYPLIFPPGMIDLVRREDAGQFISPEEPA